MAREEAGDSRSRLLSSEIFAEKLEKIISDGADKLQIVADFDRTITHALRPDGAVNTSLSMLWHFMPPEYGRRAKVLYDHYRPIEKDATLTREEKIVHLKEWFRQWQKNAVELGYSEEVLRAMIGSGLLSVREGFSEFMKLANTCKIPVLVFSAGLGDLIIELLKRDGLNAETVHVISNFARFDESGLCIGWNEDIVTGVSKDETHVQHQAWVGALERRPNVLLLGDHASDIHMADGARHETVLSVGFLNGEQDHLESFRSIFDGVIVEDGGSDVPNDILQSVARGASVTTGQ